MRDERSAEREKPPAPAATCCCAEAHQTYSATIRSVAAWRQQGHALSLSHRAALIFFFSPLAPPCFVPWPCAKLQPSFLSLPSGSLLVAGGSRTKTRAAAGGDDKTRRTSVGPGRGPRQVADEAGPVAAVLETVGHSTGARSGTVVLPAAQIYPPPLRPRVLAARCRLDLTCRARPAEASPRPTRPLASPLTLG